jgi:hypothetical protein
MDLQSSISKFFRASTAPTLHLATIFEQLFFSSAEMFAEERLSSWLASSLHNSVTTVFTCVYTRLQTHFK